MNRGVLAALILFGVAAFLYSRQSQASYGPVQAPSGDSWTPPTFSFDPGALIQTIENAVTELTTPLTMPSSEPLPTNEGTDTLPAMPAIANPIPPLPAM